ncbi:SigE family RNA polymerase sigma factor [Actinobacteria bacterium YIM 96077]|uniref:SigE family RNA polymerase sigma factor n=1 Tax=Phytoactinopolyspora halophila TaxID=1981511 RepID=A0A329QJY4_9ACTN|nr:SigE family RNA polymerase sigma factor [Phytoactinopolyspora halophila]AYY15333.1 SigE family RNA polymerase sigma factor [Actinobacteria bacterium YIM 96077]RAW12583.1 SigE family RNA polymerase sigma factor [Phytoactinopolyspora halophila]
MLTIDEASYREFVVARRRGLLRTAFLLSGDWHLAEDLVQETLAKLYLAWRRVKRRDEADGYARKTLLNVYIDSRRRPWRREHATDLSLHDGSTEHSSTIRERGSGDPAELTDPGLRRCLMNALAELPPRQRAALVLRFWEDLSVEQVADLLNCSAGTVKSQTARGLERLRTLLGDTARAEMEEQV